MWAPVVTALIAAFGPIIAEWLKDRLHAKATEFEAARIGRSTLEPDTAALLRGVHGDLPWLAFRRRWLVARLMQEAPPAVAGRVPVSPVAWAALTELAEAAT